MFWQPTGVFSRLDQGVLAGSKAVKVKVKVDEQEDSDGEGSVLQYAGVLKRSTPSQKKEPAAKPAPTTLRRLGGKFKLPPSDPPTSSSSAPDGIPPAKISVLQRLGKLPVTQSNTPASTSLADTQDNRVSSTRTRTLKRQAVANSKVSSSTGCGGGGGGAEGSTGESAGAQMDIKAISVFKRLGNKRT